MTGRDRISHTTLACETTSFGVTKPRAASLRPPPIFSTSDMICANANTPISTGRNGIPPSRKGIPSVSRGAPNTGSLPITVTTSPIAPDSRPFVIESPVSPATIDSAKTNSEKYSHGPNSSAIEASGPVVPTRNTPPRSPPKNEAQMPSQSARPGSPFFAIGKPSNIVATDDGLPGMPSSVEAISPPDSPPT